LLVQEIDSAHAVLYGRLANDKIGAQPGTGTTEFHVEKIIKDHADLPRQQMILLSRYVPILDVKNPPRYLMFFTDPKKNGEPYTGKQVDSTAILDFLAEYQRQRGNAVQALLVAANYVDHADPLVAEQAFLTLAHASDRQLGEAARNLSPQKLRKLVNTPNLEPERLGLYAFLLGASGKSEAADADHLHKLLQNPSERNFRSFEGVLAGYIAMRPREGWAFAIDTLKKDKQSFLMRYATLRTLRCYYNAAPEVYGPQVLQGLEHALAQPDIADIAIRDLCKWKRWDLTPRILANYDRTTHQSPIVKNSIVRYALACPLPEARTLVERVRRQDPALIRDFEEELMLENMK
jgi:hypothetical protein